jgi:type II secretory pathway pseudopilin PulG
MVALLVGLSIMAVALSVALPAWRTMTQREKEAELVFRGEEYARAIALFQRKYANTFPPSVDVLVEQRFLRRKYLDPITGDEFQPLLVGQALPGQAATQQGRAGGAPTPAELSATPLGGRAGILGVTSKSDRASLRVYNGRSKYNEWAFVATAASTRAGAPNTSQNPTGGIGGRGGTGGVGGVGGGQGLPGRGQQPLPGDRRPGRGDDGGAGPLRGGQFQPLGGGRSTPPGGR